MKYLILLLVLAVLLYFAAFLLESLVFTAIIYVIFLLFNIPLYFWRLYLCAIVVLGVKKLIFK